MLKRTDMYHWRKRRIDLDRHIFALESDRIADFIPVNMNTDESAIYQFNLDILVACFKRDLLLSFALCTLLDLFNDEFHLLNVKRFVRLRATVLDSVCHTLDQFACDT